MVTDKLLCNERALLLIFNKIEILYPCLYIIYIIKLTKVNKNEISIFENNLYLLHNVIYYMIESYIVFSRHVRKTR